MKGMNLQEQKKCGILVTVIGLVMFAIGFLLGDAHMDDFYNGLGCGLFVCGAVRLLRVYRLSRDPEKAADYDAMLKDERTVYVANKARSVAFFICVYAQLAAGLLALLVFKQPIIGQVLCLVTCAQSLIFVGLIGTTIRSIEGSAGGCFCPHSVWGRGKGGYSLFRKENIPPSFVQRRRRCDFDLVQEKLQTCKPL